MRIAVIGFFALCSTATAAPMDDLLKAHAACDGSVFTVLAGNADSLADKLPITAKGAVATIRVPDRRKKEGRTVRFPNTVFALGITVTGYSDEIDAFGPDLQFLYWGFFAREDVDSVARALMPHVPNSNRMKRDREGNYVRLEIFDGVKWEAVSDPLLYAGLPGTFVERAYILERSDDSKFPGTRITCSLQGPVDKYPDVLPAARPDLR